MAWEVYFFIIFQRKIDGLIQTPSRGFLIRRCKMETFSLNLKGKLLQNTTVKLQIKKKLMQPIAWF